MLADAVRPYGGKIVWRCFVYNCRQDWRDKTTDRPKAAWDHYAYLDGQFADNVILQIKHGPFDFQVREPLSPLLLGMKKTNLAMELQLAQEYTGHQTDLYTMIPMWRELFDELPAENIEMIYWFPEFPDRQIRLPYSESAYRDDMEYLKLRAREMTLPAETDYPGTDKVRLCRYCEYYAYCFPGNMPFVPEAGDELPEDIFQAEFFFPDITDDDDHEEKSF